LYGEGDQQPEGKAARVECNVERRRVSPADEVLMQLVGSRVGNPDQQCRELPAERAQEQCPEDRVLGDVRALAQYFVPGAEAGRKGGHR